MMTSLYSEDKENFKIWELTSKLKNSISRDYKILKLTVFKK